jgi:hypothetical protein
MVNFWQSFLAVVVFAFVASPGKVVAWKKPCKWRSHGEQKMLMDMDPLSQVSMAR